MKRLVFSLFASSILASSASAWVGGPFDNNAFFGREVNGTFQGVVVGRNVSGIMVFGTTSASSTGEGSDSDMGIFGNGGRALVFANGNMLYCNISSSIDVPNRKIAIALDGSVSHGATDSAQTQTVATVTSGTSTKTVLTTTTYVLEGASQIRAALDGRISTTYPTLRYAGSGSLLVGSFTNLEQDIPNESAPSVSNRWENIPVSFSGLRTSTNQVYVSGSLPWAFPNITTSTTVITLD